MARHHPGPRRSESVRAYLRETRIIAAGAVLALIAGIVSDLLIGHFWTRHALLAGLVASVIVVMLSVALVNEALERRNRRRWSVLAQYVMLELVRNARLIWTGVLDLTGSLRWDESPSTLIEEGGRVVRDTPRLTAAVRELVASDDRRRELRREINGLAISYDEILGRWAAVMLNADVYAEIVDRHVELASDVSWLRSLLDHQEPGADVTRSRTARTSPAVQFAGDISGDVLVDRVVVITQLAERLDRGTLQLALRIVPVAWWEARLATTDPMETGTSQ